MQPATSPTCADAPRETLIRAMCEALTVADVRAGNTIPILIGSGYYAHEIRPVIDRVEALVLARVPHAGSDSNAGALAVLSALLLLVPDTAYAADGLAPMTVAGIALGSAVIGGAFGFLICAILAAGRDADAREGICALEQRSPSGSCLTCGSMRGQPCRGERV